MLKKLTKSILLIILFTQSAIAENWVEGAIYSAPYESGYTIVKVLKLDTGGVHLRLYSNLYPNRPNQVDEAKLFMAGVGQDKNVPLSMGHLPISHQSAATWRMEFIQQSVVTKEELEGYYMWKEAEGGYF